MISARQTIQPYRTETELRLKAKFNDLVFDKKRHSYSIWRNNRYVYLPSVSSIVSGLTPRFNVETILPLSAEKATREEGRIVTKEELGRRWKQINRVACNLGTRTHRFMERFTGFETPSSVQEEAGVKYIKSLGGKYRISFRELRAYSERYNYAGTMDLPLEVVGKSSFVIADYKTNASDLFKAYDFMNPPFDSLEATSYNKIQIQLGLYQIMLEDEGLNIAGRHLVHLKGDGNFRVFELFDLTLQLRDYLKSRPCLQ